MTAQHTAGPWHIGMNPGPFVYGPKGEEIARVNSELNERSENSANAALIASAPDLLDENQRLREALFMLTDHACETHPHFESPRGQEDIARAVVALGDDAKRLAYQRKVIAALASGKERAK